MFFIKKHITRTLFWLILLLFAASIPAYSQIIYQDDFESGVSGWSNNSSTTHPSYSQFLGRFDNSPNQTSRTFAVPSASQSLSIEFDLYRFDSWDNTSRWGFDRFEIEIDGTQLFSYPMTPGPPSLTGSSGNISWVFTPVGPYTNMAYGGWGDQTYRIVITITNPGTSVALTLRTALNQGGNDESGGFDNFLVEATPSPPDVTVGKASVLDAGAVFHLPDESVIYTIDVTSVGGPLDIGTLRITDYLPPEVAMFTGDFDGSGNAVLFTDLSTPASGITCCGGSTIAFSDDPSPGLVFDYTPNGGDDEDVTGFEIIPSGQVREGVTTPVNLRFQFRARIK